MPTWKTARLRRLYGHPDDPIEANTDSVTSSRHALAKTANSPAPVTTTQPPQPKRVKREKSRPESAYEFLNNMPVTKSAPDYSQLTAPLTENQSGMIAYAIHSSRQNWLSGSMFETFWTRKPRGKKLADGQVNLREKMTKLHQCTLTLGPHTFAVKLFMVRDDNVSVDEEADKAVEEILAAEKKAKEGADSSKEIQHVPPAEEGELKSKVQVETMNSEISSSQVNQSCHPVINNKTEEKNLPEKLTASATPEENKENVVDEEPDKSNTVKSMNISEPDTSINNKPTLDEKANSTGSENNRIASPPKKKLQSKKTEPGAGKILPKKDTGKLSNDFESEGPSQQNKSSEPQMRQTTNAANSGKNTTPIDGSTSTDTSTAPARTPDGGELLSTGNQSDKINQREPINRPISGERVTQQHQTAPIVNQTEHPQVTQNQLVVYRLQQMAARDPSLSELMKLVASGAAPPESIAIFQEIINRVKASLTVPNFYSVPPVQQKQKRAAPIHNAKPTVQRTTPHTSYQCRPNAKAIMLAIEFDESPAERYLFPKRSIIEYIPNKEELLWSFLHVVDAPKNSKQKSKFTPVTAVFHQIPLRVAQTMERCVRKPEVVHYYMKKILEEGERTEPWNVWFQIEKNDEVLLDQISKLSAPTMPLAPPVKKPTKPRKPRGPNLQSQRGIMHRSGMNRGEPLLIVPTILQRVGQPLIQAPSFMFTFVQ